MRQGIQSLKSHIKEVNKSLKEQQAHLTELSARLDTTTDSTEKRQLKIEKKITETAITDMQTLITQLDADLVE